jgi:uncharacterized protein YyaL (SSP411 family)
MLQEVYKRFMPDKILIQINPEYAEKSKTFARDIISKSDKTKAYVCENFACNLPAYTVEDFLKLL